MGKQKQQVISRFFAPKPNLPSSSSSSDPPLPKPPARSPKITATVSFSPSKRLFSSRLASPKPPKNPKLSPHTQNPIPTSLNPTLHEKFLQKLLEPSEEDLEPSSKFPPSSNQKPSSSAPTKCAVKYTPLEQQVVDLKKRYPDVLLMIEVGYKYRFFGEDAEVAARVLGIYAHVDHNFLTASVPTFRLNVHVRRLVGAGYKVGVVKQTETAAIKAHGLNRLGPFCRGLSALYTKATLEAAEDLGGGEEGCGGDCNYLLCVVEKGVVVENLNCGVESHFDTRIGIVAVEISTGDIVHGEFNDNFIRAGLESVVLSLSPAELLLGEPLSKQTEKMLLAFSGPASNVRVERASRDCFKDGGALAEVMSLFENISEDNVATHQKAGETEQANHRLAIDVLKNNADGTESGSLLQSMNHTLTIFGSRLLRHWVSHPLCDRNMIYARLDAVSEIAESMGSSQNFGGVNEKETDAAFVRPEIYHLLSSVLTTLGRSTDIQRGITRIFHRTATATEFIAVIQAILFAGKQLRQLRIEEENNVKMQEKTISSVLLRKLILTASSSSVIGNAARLLSSLKKEAADQGDLLNLFIISDGQFTEVARARTVVQLAIEKLDLLIGLYRKQLGMCKLEFMSVSGVTHLIELPLDVKVPSNWVKVNSTKKTIRYHPPEVLTALDQLSLANEELTVVCRAAWDSFLREFGKYYAEFQSAVQALAALDCLISLAVLARNKNYVRPVFVDDSEPVQIHICSGRHPVLETILQDNFVPNDTSLHANAEYCQIVTGPNMGGKSCYIRQVALITIMAQVGSFVPASSATLHVLDDVHTRMGASDSIQQGRSTFLEELSETSLILHKCTARSLVIIDELGRGTSTHDGVAIAYATLHYLLEQKRCMILFVTHYPKIVDIKNEFPGSVGAYHVSYLTSQKHMEDSNSDKNVDDIDHDDVTYLYKLVPGISERSFGFKVAQLAQLPLSCIHRATVMAAKLESAVGSRVKNRMPVKLLLETSSICEEQDESDNFLKPPNCTGAGGIDGSECPTNAYKDFFFNLKSASGDDDPAKSFLILKHARSLANNLISRV
ncbi:DNA mismatch repair protein MSH3 isoform X2 [Malania oleifera]|uniref:DNA mismatch repair protein MSH3 isoform X2 n=1 Tax=Malania oleifera TaxID=397392 RepID=UPI0025AEA873|nr:DNA mismatch repair protein MSH3 isoform X2 [Malania oleifera]